MFAQLLLSLLALSGAVLAVPYSPPSGQCNTAASLCCNTFAPASGIDASTTGLLNSLSIPIENILNNVATGCSPLVGGDGCGAYPVCCEDNSFNGVVSLGCTPLDTNL